MLLQPQTVERPSPLLSIFSSLLTHPPPPYLTLCQHVSAQLNVIISNCLWAAAALLPLTISGCLPFAPLPRLPIPYPPQQRATHFAHFFLYCFFSLLVHWFSLIGFLWRKVFLTPVTFLATFCCTCHTHLPIEQCDAKRRVRCAISISILNTFHSLFLSLSLPLSLLSLSPLPFAGFNFNAKSINSLQGAS